MAQQSIIDQLAAALEEHRTRLALLPAFRALADGTLPLSGYVGLLQSLAIILDPLEDACARAERPLVAEAWGSGLPRLHLVEHDLAALSKTGPPPPEATGALLRAHALAESIRQAAVFDSAALPGYLYGLLDWPLGVVELAPQPGLSADQGYLLRGGHDTARAALASRIAAAAETEEQQLRLLAGLGEALAALAQICTALHPLVTQPLRELASTLNPAAGMHAIPDDLREIRAALRAGAISWHQFPYYAWRYGGRGRAFTHSDSAWLATLPAYPWEEVLRQVTWLGRVLAARGMPQWLLEQHLDVLHDQLVAAVPEKGDAYAVLHRAAAHLCALRQSHIDDDGLRALAEEFDARADQQWARRLPGSGALIAAAVADERAGITNAVGSLLAWLRDAQRFPPAWVAAVDHTLQRAREAAR